MPYASPSCCHSIKAQIILLLYNQPCKNGGILPLNSGVTLCSSITLVICTHVSYHPLHTHTQTHMNILFLSSYISHFLQLTAWQMFEEESMNCCFSLISLVILETQSSNLLNRIAPPRLRGVNWISSRGQIPLSFTILHYELGCLEVQMW